MTQEAYDTLSAMIERLRATDTEIRQLVIGRHRPWLPHRLLRRFGFQSRLARMARIDALEDARRDMIANLMTKIFENIQSQAAAIVARPYGALAEDQALIRAEWSEEQTQKDASAAALQEELESIHAEIKRLQARLALIEMRLLPLQDPYA